MECRPAYRPTAPLKPKHIWAIHNSKRSQRKFAISRSSTALWMPSCEPVLLLGRSKLESTVRYLGIEVDDAMEMSEQIDL